MLSDLDAWKMNEGSWFLVPGSWFLVPGSWFLVPGSWFLVPVRKARPKFSDKQGTRNQEHIDIMPDFYCDQILTGKIPVDVVYETERVLAFHHTRPYFERHIVIIPKIHIDSLASVEATDPALAGDMIVAISKISRDLERESGGCRICSNVGDYQDSNHLHVYIHAGKRLRTEDGIPIERKEAD